MKGYSTTVGGIITIVVGTILVDANFSQNCANEIISNVPVLVLGAFTWYKRYQAGDINATGFRK